MNWIMMVGVVLIVACAAQFAASNSSAKGRRQAVGFCVLGVLILLAGWALENNSEYRRMRQVAEDVPGESVNKRPFWDGILYDGK
jgi:hypothetical protein